MVPSDTSNQELTLEELLQAVPFVQFLKRRRLVIYYGWPLVLLWSIAIDRLDRTGQLITMAVGVVVLLAVLVWQRRILRAYRSGTAREAASSQVHKCTRRLHCRGHPQDLAGLRNLPVSSFEPIIVTRLHALSARAFTGSLLCAILVLMPICAWYKTPVWAPAVIAALLWWLPAMMQCAYPVYYRIVPGRMDVLRFHALSSRARHVRSVQLDTADVVCRYDNYILEIRQGGGDDAVERVDLFGLNDPHQFVKGVFQGAICEEPAPRLPRDRLLG